MKRLFAYFVAVCFGWASVTQPARAFAPIAVLAAPQIVTASGVGYALSAIAGVIGVAGMYFTIKDAQDNAIRIPLGPNANNVAPEPQAAATVQPTGGGTSTTYFTYYGGTLNSSNCASTGGSTVDAACAAVGGQMGSSYRCYPPSGADVSTWNYGAAVTYGYVNYGTCTSGGEVTCPAGYTLSGSTCQLTNARQAADDKICDLLVTMGQFATANDKNCSNTVDGTKLAPMIRDGNVIAYGTNSSGQPIMWEVKPGTQAYTLTQYEQIQTATQTQVQTTTVTVDPATSTITSVATQTSPGSISSPSASTAPTVTTSTDPVNPTNTTNTPTVQKDDTKPADMQTCGLPGTPACNIDDTQFDGKDNFSNPKNTEISDKLDQNKSQLEGLKNTKPDISASWLPSLMPGNASACAPLTFDFTLHNAITGTLAAPNVQLDICDKLELVRAILGYMLGVWTVWYVWRRFTTSNQGS